MSQASRPAIVIIGGGLAGVLAAIKIIDATATPLDIAIVESRAELGRGIAYSTPDPDHLVNGPARVFSLHADRPEHLTQWVLANAGRRGWAPDEGAPPGDAFLPRILYGDYVQDELARALRDGEGRVRFQHVRDTAVDLAPARLGYAVHLASGAALAADQVVLATGLHAAERGIRIGARLRDSGRYVGDVWRDGAFAGAERDGEILLLGTSLTTLDALISLEKQGFRGTYVAISRRGQLVNRRREVEPWANFLDAAALPRRIGDLLRLVQRERRAVAAAGEDWQRLTPVLKQHLIGLWAGASDAERRRFVRHLRVFWDVSLHRAAPGSIAFLEQVQAQGRFRQVAGTVTDLAAAPDGRVDVVVRPRGASAPQTLTVDRVVNGLGHDFDWRRIAHPLVRNAVARDLVRPHPTGYGIAADAASGAVLDAAGRASQSLFAIGHPLRGASWESSAIGEQVLGATRLGETFAKLHAARRDVA
ncbi:FAD/NAD(P)-binding protein [Roseixanthobacter liquoris]|uniref:FAD/NAD(P)-binding protein n=1 Tax=Roseixanthobacter liquoris TaxID=3119921 RepID=UPI00372A47C4